MLCARCTRSGGNGPLGVYREADRRDYVSTYRDQSVQTRISPEDYVTQAKQWVSQGVQIIGGCCGIELEYIRPLRDALPTHVPGEPTAG
ncbi:MAG: homocysteine S-methyltransferase family protein [Acidiferrobacterales bacterium]